MKKQKSFPQKREMVVRMSLCAADVKTNANIFYKSLIFIGFSNANNLSNMKISLQIKGFAAYQVPCAQTYPQNRCINSGYLRWSSGFCGLIKNYAVMKTLIKSGT
ncbi:hypothetical protein ACO0K0_11015 [Undibacterium sp. SXout11W]|uniref:hypothetical protein n=1 Tax=Undibacterium sp. SXout11W TaxID=3413050 RepID=UPI003BF1C2A7